MMLGVQESEEILETAKADTQVRTDGGRYLDLTVKIGNELVCGLENKISADEEIDQVKDYVEFLKRQPYARWVFIFLSSTGKNPETISPEICKTLKADGNLFCRSYERDISAWLRSCACFCRERRVESFANEMARWAECAGGREKEMSDQLTAEAVTRFLLRNPQYREPALSVIVNSESIRSGLIINFVQEFKARLQAEFSEAQGWEVEESIISALQKQSRRLPGIWVRKNSWPEKCSIGIEADKQAPRVSDLYFGIWYPDAKQDLRTSLFSALQAKLRRGQKGTQWPWWSWLPEHDGVSFRDWCKQNPLLVMSDSAERPGLLQRFLNLYLDIAAVVVPILSTSAESSSAAGRS